MLHTPVFSSVTPRATETCIYLYFLCQRRTGSSGQQIAVVEAARGISLDSLSCRDEPVDVVRGCSQGVVPDLFKKICCLFSVCLCEIPVWS